MDRQKLKFPKKLPQEKKDMGYISKGGVKENHGQQGILHPKKNNGISSIRKEKSKEVRKK